MGSALYVVVLLLLGFASNTCSKSVIQLLPENYNSFNPDAISGHRKVLRDDSLYCDSWRFSVETNDAGRWNRIPIRCEAYVEAYVNSDHYASDSEIVADYSLEFAKTAEVTGNGKDVWVFDIDETLLSNVPYYAAHGFGSEIFDENSFNEWVALAEAPAIPSSLRLYKELQNLGFKIVLLTGRDEPQRNATKKNLVFAGFNNWEKLFLRGTSDIGKSATLYKSEKRKELVDEGYTIHGSSGDQWSDLQGFAVAKRSFKLPNPMYYIF